MRMMTDAHMAFYAGIIARDPAQAVFERRDAPRGRVPG